MTGPSRPDPRRQPKDPRQERLAQALRENLKRRKAQIRGRAEQAAEDDEPAPGKDSGRNG